jgi:hypothetical protein
MRGQLAFLELFFMFESTLMSFFGPAFRSSELLFQLLDLLFQTRLRI